MNTSADVARNRKIRGLRINSFAAVVMLMIEFGLGIGVNLYASLPASGNGKGVLGAFLSAITDGPIALNCEHYNDERPHRSRGLRPPSSRGDPVLNRRGNAINRRERLGGLLSEYYLEPRAA
jgi:hypothetical protein